ncbi:MAG TPA: alanine racemase, partial [Eubacterium sp.]|nr:alanine racemase [Eubacterium sp.]
MENLDKYYRNYIKINLDNIYDNISVLKENAGENTGLVAVIKTDGYGHGA